MGPTLHFFGMALLASVVTTQEQTAQSDPPAWAFDFRGFQITIDSTDDAVLVACGEPSPPEDSGPDWHLKGFVFDGVVWGNDFGAYAGHYYNRLRQGGERSWRRFGSEHVKFPSGTFVFGRTPDLVWRGYTNSSIELRNANDDENPPYEFDMTMFDRLVRFSRHPVREFEAIMAPRDAWESERETVTLPDGSTWVSLRSRSMNGTGAMLVAARFDAGSAESRPDEWIYISKDLANRRSTLWRMWVKETEAVGRLLPDRPAELFSTHRDVEAIETAGIRDYTGSEDWPADATVVHPLKDRSWLSPASMLRLTFGLLMIATSLEFFRRLHELTRSTHP